MKMIKKKKRLSKNKIYSKIMHGLLIMLMNKKKVKKYFNQNRKEKYQRRNDIYREIKLDFAD